MFSKLFDNRVDEAVEIGSDVLKICKQLTGSMKFPNEFFGKQSDRKPLFSVLASFQNFEQERSAGHVNTKETSLSIFGIKGECAIPSKPFDNQCVKFMLLFGRHVFVDNIRNCPVVEMTVKKNLY